MKSCHIDFNIFIFKPQDRGSQIVQGKGKEGGVWNESKYDYTNPLKLNILVKKFVPRNLEWQRRFYCAVIRGPWGKLLDQNCQV